MQYYQKDYNLDPTKFASLGINQITEWQVYTPVSPVTNGSVQSKWRRVGQNMEIDFTVNYSGASSYNFTPAQIIPSGYTLDESKLSIGATWTRQVVGYGSAIDNGVANYSINYLYDSTSDIFFPLPTITAPGSVDFVSIRFSLPIQGWTNSQNIVIGNEPVITNWASYTPTFTNLGTVTNIDVKWRRVGNSIEVRGAFRTGTVSGSATPTFTLPNGLVSQNEYTSGTGGLCGYIARDAATEGNMVALLARNSNIITLGGLVGYTTTYNNLLSTYAISFLGSNELSNFSLSVPIAGWDQFNGFYSLSTIQPQNLCKAWARVSNTGVLLKGFNVSSITKVGTGLYQINYQTPMADANYSISGICKDNGRLFENGNTANYAYVAIRDGANALVDAHFSIQVFGD